MAKNDYIATERLYLNKKGEVVGAKDPSKETLLVAEGCALPYADAVKYGLINVKADTETEATAPAVEEAAPTETPKTPTEPETITPEATTETKPEPTDATTPEPTVEEKPSKTPRAQNKPNKESK
jgi:hypothetical protein